MHSSSAAALCACLALAGCDGTDDATPSSTSTNSAQDAGTDAAADAAPDASPDADSPDAAPDLTKWNPGHYVRFAGNDPLTRMGRIVDEEHVRGALLQLRWRDLEPTEDSYDLSIIEGALQMLRPWGKHLFLLIQERSFGGDCSSVPVPDYIQQDPVYDGGFVAMTNGCVAKFWDEEVLARLVALYGAIGSRWDGDSAFEGVVTPESSVAVANPADRPAPELLKETIEALATGIHDALPQSHHIINMNWLSGGGTPTAYMEEVAQHVADLGSGGVGNPDTVPCRYYGTCPSGYIPVYDIHLAFQGTIAIGPSAQTAQLEFDETEAVFDLAVHVFEANYLFWDESFWSVDDGFIAGYLEDQVLPTLASHQGAINTACPTSLAPCANR
ncbi:MAG: hypothetical protein JRI23_06455 [Deltaproteobacteria bacterium]|jgi:hypothetical protein|nr:hypothetical protein [Deltaproteobacteria bacterium]MBW2531220.1 hypothetical protein [Deltaproteobacteria bacterium]